MKKYFILFLMLFIISCDKIVIRDGIIKEKKHEDERYYIHTTYYNTGTNGFSPGISFKSGQINLSDSKLYYDDEDFIIILEKENEKKLFFTTWYVSKEFYNSVSVGDFVAIEDSTFEYIDNNKFIKEATQEDIEKYR